MRLAKSTDIVRVTHVVYVEQDDVEYVTQELEEAFQGSQVGQWRPKGYPKVEPVYAGSDAQAAREFFAADQYDDETEDE